MKKTIHYVLILDKSGSMQDIKPIVIQSFNEQVEMIGKLLSEEPKTDIKITLCTFNDTVQMHFIGGNADQIQKLTPTDYQPDSMTALYDAIGISFLKISEFKKPADKVVCAIFTDGLENASKHYSAEDIRYKIKKAESESWNIRFFCRYEDVSFYKRKLDLPLRFMCDVTADEQGLHTVANEIMFCIKNEIDDDKNE